MLTSVARSVLSVLPAGPAFGVTRFLAGIPTRLPLKERDRDALALAERFEFGDRSRKVGWSWGSGPPVVCVHGWGGRAAQVATLARHLAERGFEAVTFDVTAHGESEGWRVTFEDFIADVGELARTLGRDVHAWVGHSAGGLCMMAAREREGIRAPRYVCLCAPRSPYVPIRAIRKRLNPSEAVLERCRHYYAEQFDASWDELDRGRLFAPPDSPDDERLLLIYDETDDIVEHTDGDRIRDARPSATVLKTRGLGHREVLWSPEVMDEVGRFLRAE